MRRYWIEKKFFQDNQVRIEGDHFHHICEVCRQGEGSRFEVLSEGKAYFVEISEISKKTDRSKFATVRILETRDIPQLPHPHIHLCVSISKFQTMDTIVEKAVELGVFELHPFVSDFSFIREKNSDKLTDKIERWNRIVKAATQQCGRGDLMQIQKTASLQELLKKMNQTPQSAGLFPYEGSSVQTVRDAISSIKNQQGLENIWLYVGSEGGFSQNEVELFAKSGLQSSSLGEQVLRVETACLNLVSILKYEFNS